MQVQDRLKLLEKIYQIHDAFASDTQTACRKGCAACCTCNITATTMEGVMVYDRLNAEGRTKELKTMVESPPAARFQPKLTLNQMVAIYAKGQEPPEEMNDPSAGTCQLLNDGICSIYEVRPLGCRAMLSSSDCSTDGQASMPPFMLTVNNVIMQYVEAIDQPGGSGNLIDILGFLAQDSLRNAYLDGKVPTLPPALAINRSFPVLMVPPEHHSSIDPLIQSLNAAVGQFR